MTETMRLEVSQDVSAARKLGIQDFADSELQRAAALAALNS